MLGFGIPAVAQSAPPLGSAQTFVVLGASTVTSTGPTVIVGNLGVSPGTAVTGFPPGTISGGAIHPDDPAATSAQADAHTAYGDLLAGNLGVSPGTAVTGFPPGTISGGAIHPDDPAATSAQADAHTAYGDLLAESCGTNLSGLTLGTSVGATTLAPGVYCFASSAQLTGTLTLSGAGPYIFQIGSTLITATNSAVALTNGATAANVFWQVGSSATLGVDSVVAGTVLAAVSITVA